MANFCKHCGKPLVDGTCNCSGYAAAASAQSAYKPGFWESFKNRIGLGDPELNKTDAFETDLQIVPDLVKPNDAEVPVKQYTVAKLRTRIGVIPYLKAVGRMQVTNKRVIFRAPGRCIAGRTTLQHEFDIDEIAGIEARREFVFNAWDLLFAFIVMAVGGAAMTALITAMYSDVSDGYVGLAFFLSLIFGGGACVPFFVLKKKWLLKCLCLGGAFAPMLVNGFLVYGYGKGMDETITQIGGAMLIFSGVVALLLALFCVFLNSINPNLVLVVKNKFANETIDIKRRKLPPFCKNSENTGFAEVLPTADAEYCIREINAVISDIQNLGDAGVEKWKA